MEQHAQSDDLCAAFHSFYENFMGASSSALPGPRSQPAAAHSLHAQEYAYEGYLHPHGYPHHDLSAAHAGPVHTGGMTGNTRASIGGYSTSGSSSTRLTPGSPMSSHLGMSVTPRSSGLSSSAATQRDGTLTPLTTVGSGSGSESGYGVGAHAHKRMRLEDGHQIRGLVDSRMQYPSALHPGVAAGAHMQQHFEASAWAPQPYPPDFCPQHMPSSDDYYIYPHPSSDFTVYDYDPGWHDGAHYYFDEQEYEEQLRSLRVQHEQQQGQRRRGKLTAERRYRAGETIRIPVKQEPRKDGKAQGGRAGAKDKRSAREAGGTTTAVPIERNQERIASANAPPQAYLEVHTLFVRPPASLFEERERNRIREERRRRVEVKTEEGEQLSEKAAGKRRQVASLESSGGRQPSKRHGTRRVFGPSVCEWTYEYQDGGAPASLGTIKAEDGTVIPPFKRKRGRPPVRDALEVALQTGVPLHPWAEPLPTAPSLKMEESPAEAGPSEERKYVPAPETRKGVDRLGRVCEFPLPAAQLPYAKTMREQYRTFAAPGRARLDLERMWGHRVKVWQAERGRALRPYQQGRKDGRKEAGSAQPAPVFLRRNVEWGRRRVSKWDCGDTA
ncbi:hypothetical protein OC835_000161 [Tilletia horrida]|nr:hypothetical protein OC835_000161 [Tilletia horrida]